MYTMYNTVHITYLRLQHPSSHAGAGNLVEHVSSASAGCRQYVGRARIPATQHLPTLHQGTCTLAITLHVAVS